MRHSSNMIASLRLTLILLMILCGPALADSTSGEGARFNISFPGSLRQQPVTGRLFLMISQTNEPEVRLQSIWFNSPEMVAKDVQAMKPGQVITLDGSMPGSPLPSLKELAPGDYYVQAILSVYTQFHRKDGRTLWAHMDQWEGQQFNTSPGNLYSEVHRIHVEPHGSYELTLNGIIPPVRMPPDTEWVRYVKIQSKLLTEFWGQPIYVGAVVLLPRNYAANSTTHYPVLYRPKGHFTLAAPYDFRTDDVPESEKDRLERENGGQETGHQFYQSWTSAHFPRMIIVSFLDPTPLSDWSSALNSVNTGPYGDAIMQELIPYIEKQFRIIREPYARILSGRDSSGREALTLQLHHPEFFGGAWIFQPWAFTFHNYFSLDIYTQDNAFVIHRADVPFWTRTQSEWIPVERPLARIRSGATIATFRQLSQHDVVMAGMAGGDCIGADDAILGPVGPDGFPQHLWNRSTGEIDPKVAEYWREHGDLEHYAEVNWSRIGPQLDGKLHFFAGEMDHFERNHGVHQFETFLRERQNPQVEASFTYGALKGDFQPMTNAELIKTMADYIVARGPANADMSWRKQEDVAP